MMSSVISMISINIAMVPDCHVRARTPFGQLSSGRVDESQGDDTVGGLVPPLDRQVGLALVEGRRTRERRGELVNGHPLLPFVFGGVPAPGFREVSCGEPVAEGPPAEPIGAVEPDHGVGHRHRSARQADTFRPVLVRQHRLGDGLAVDDVTADEFQRAPTAPALAAAHRQAVPIAAGRREHGLAVAQRKPCTVGQDRDDNCHVSTVKWFSLTSRLMYATAGLVCSAVQVMVGKSG